LSGPTIAAGAGIGGPDNPPIKSGESHDVKKVCCRLAYCWAPPYLSRGGNSDAFYAGPSLRSTLEPISAWPCLERSPDCAMKVCPACTGLRVEGHPPSHNKDESSEFVRIGIRGQVAAGLSLLKPISQSRPTCFSEPGQFAADGTRVIGTRKRAVDGQATGRLRGRHLSWRCRTVRGRAGRRNHGQMAERQARPLHPRHQGGGTDGIRALGSGVVPQASPGCD
jgi:hypothetical protein